MQGRPPKPLAHHKEADHYRPSRHKDDFVGVPNFQFVYNIIPDPPEQLNDYGKDLWTRQLSEACKVEGFLSFMDMELFYHYCLAHQEHELLREENPKPSVKSQGVVKSNPTYKALQEKKKECLSLSNALGIGPVARTKVEMQKQVLETAKSQIKLKTYKI